VDVERAGLQLMVVEHGGVPVELDHVEPA